MKLLLTGALGTIGQTTLKFLAESQYSIRCFDLPTRKNKRIYRKLAQMLNFEMVWGDVRKIEDVQRSMANIDVVIHLAAVIAPQSERQPELAYDVNVLGTENLINTAVQANVSKFIYASSLTTYGSTMSMPPPRTVTDPLSVTNHYSAHKIKCEKMLLESNLPVTILRVALVLDPQHIVRLDPEMFNLPLAQRIELLHPLDAGRAFANAVSADAIGQILLLGGGRDWQITYQILIKELLDLFGLSMPPANAFRIPRDDDDWYYTDWLDTEASQSLLNFQTITFQEFLEECRKQTQPLRFFVRPFRKIAAWFLLRLSDHY